ncbi:MAG: hypothetical protein ACLSWI_07495 [Candidatus Gastranaerophilaceae bacterium]
MSVSNVSMNAQGSRPQRKQPSNMPYVLTSMGVGAIGGGAYGYFKNNLVNKEGFYTDEFLSKTASGFVEQDKLAKEQMQKALKEFIDLKPVDEAINIKPSKVSHKQIKNYLFNNAEMLNIIPAEGETLKQAVERYMRDRPKEILNSHAMNENVRDFMTKGHLDKTVDDIYLNGISKQVTRKGNTFRAPLGNDTSLLMKAIEEDLHKSVYFTREQAASHLDPEWISKFIDNVFDKKTKKFKAVSEEAPKELMDFIKKCAKEVNSTSVKLKNAAFLGGISLLAMGAVSSIIAMVTNKKS